MRPTEEVSKRVGVKFFSYRNFRVGWTVFWPYRLACAGIALIFYIFFHSPPYTDPFVSTVARGIVQLMMAILLIVFLFCVIDGAGRRAIWIHYGRKGKADSFIGWAFWWRMFIVSAIGIFLGALLVTPISQRGYELVKDNVDPLWRAKQIVEIGIVWLGVIISISVFQIFICGHTVHVLLRKLWEVKMEIKQTEEHKPKPLRRFSRRNLRVGWTVVWPVLLIGAAIAFSIGFIDSWFLIPSHPFGATLVLNIMGIKGVPTLYTDMVALGATLVLTIVGIVLFLFVWDWAGKRAIWIHYGRKADSFIGWAFFWRTWVIGVLTWSIIGEWIGDFIGIFALKMVWGFLTVILINFFWIYVCGYTVHFLLRRLWGTQNESSD